MIEYLFDKLFLRVKEERGLSIDDISEKTGINRATLYRLAKERSAADYNISLQYVDRICVALRASLDQVIRFKRK